MIIIDDKVSKEDAISDATSTVIGLTAGTAAADKGWSLLMKAGPKKSPALGSVVTSGFVLMESGGHAMKGDFKLAGASLVVGIPEVLGNIVGCGLGDAAREGARGLLIDLAGDKYKTVETSDLRTLATASYHYVADSMRAIETGGSRLAYLKNMPNLPSDFTAVSYSTMKSPTYGNDSLLSASVRFAENGADVTVPLVLRAAVKPEPKLASNLDDLTPAPVI